jgi:hypothetical protein
MHDRPPRFRASGRRQAEGDGNPESESKPVHAAKHTPAKPARRVNLHERWTERGDLGTAYAILEGNRGQIGGLIVKFQNAKNDLAHLNRAGSQGWEAVGWTESKTSFSILMKRPVSE